MNNPIKDIFGKESLIKGIEEKTSYVNIKKPVFLTEMMRLKRFKS